MSELKDYDIMDIEAMDDARLEKSESGIIQVTRVYIKSEADKVIALLKDKANYNEYAYKLKSEELADTCRFYEEELRHQKYKRCLAMAKWCFTKSNYHFVLARHGEDALENNRRSVLYSKWHKRWLKLAEMFK